MKENYVYPIKIKEEDGVFLITFPDFPDQITDAIDEPEAIRNAQEVLALCIIDNETQGIENPNPSKENDIMLEEGEKVVFVHLWMPYFRNITKEVYVKKTLTIPQWLDLLAKEKDVNFSAVLVNGLKQELGIEGKNNMAKKIVMEEGKKRKHFIAVLGTGTYQQCTYYFGDRDYNTRFVQEAILKLACGELSKEDRITICITDDARKRNWEDRVYSQWEIDNHKGTEGETYQGLHSALESCLKSMPDIGQSIHIEEKNIATGKDSHEIAQMFFEIYDVIDENEEIYFDITHGLRNIPMLVMTILEYAKVTKNISIGGIYYGAFEVGTSDAKTGEKKVPIYDLTSYHTILNVAKCIQGLIDYTAPAEGLKKELRNLTDEFRRIQEKWDV